MSKRMPPSVVEIALYHYYSPEPHPNRQTPAYQGAVRGLVQAGILHNTPSPNPNDSGLDITQKGRAWVEMICRTPFPEKREIWIDPRIKPPSLADLLEGDVNL